MEFACIYFLIDQYVSVYWACRYWTSKFTSIFLPSLISLAIGSARARSQVSHKIVVGFLTPLTLIAFSAVERVVE